MYTNAFTLLISKIFHSFIKQIPDRKVVFKHALRTIRNALMHITYFMKIMNVHVCNGGEINQLINKNIDYLFHIIPKYAIAFQLQFIDGLFSVLTDRISYSSTAAQCSIAVTKKI